ncbi:chaperonin 10-like protein [Mycena galericulata]|nr:chaperonin 10-like protein [Mycena galericulata]
MSVEFTVFKGSASDGIIESTTHRDTPKGNQVLVKITHSGICGTDEHYKHADMVLGHEGVGTVEQIGETVAEFKVGDLVGWGYVHKDQYCQTREQYGTHNFDQGSFGSHAIWDAKFLFKIPEGLAPEHAAPLMCGGATVFEVIESYNIRPTDRVGVVGIGGLGHMAILFLAKMGVSVVVFSSSESKREEAMGLGAAEFYAAKDVTEFKLPEKLSHLIITTSSLPDWNPFLRVLKPRASIFPLTVSFSDLVIPILPIMVGGFKIQGSIVAARSVHKRMLDFAARNNVAPLIERFPLTKAGVEDGMARLRDGKVRYRAVLVAQ